VPYFLQQILIPVEMLVVHPQINKWHNIGKIDSNEAAVDENDGETCSSASGCS
jgi:hypothetical protein